jgi:hypothetical protein
MYSVSEVYTNIGNHGAEIQIAFGLLVVSAYFQMGMAIWLGFRDRTHAIPLIPLMMFFAHDLEHMLRHSYWFHTIGNPFFTAGYWTFPIYIIAELLILFQMLRYSRADLFPGASLSQSILIMGALQIGVFVVYIWAHEQFRDPLYLVVALGLTQFLSHAFNIPMLMRRRSRRGQSLAFAINIFLGAGILNWFVGMPLFAVQFRTPVHYAMGAVVAALGLVYIYMLARAPRYSGSATLSATRSAAIGTVEKSAALS